MSTTLRSNEEYRCNHCGKRFTLQDVFKEWTCPDCSLPILIKVETNESERARSCHRLKLPNIQKGHLFLLGDHVHEILDIQPNRLMLKNHGQYPVHLDEYHLIVQGSWFDR